MKKAEEYRAHADECIAMASNTQDQGHKQQLLRMAETWKMLAVHRERQPKKSN